MTTIEDQVARFKDRKEQTVRDRADLRNVVDFYRGGQPAASVIVFDGDPAAMLQVVKIGAMMFSDVDEIWMATDTYGSGLLNSPLTGKRWAPQEMEKVFRDGRFPDAVHEQLALMHGRRGQPIEQVTLVYEIGTSAFGTPTITWQDQRLHVEGAGRRMTGRLPDTIREALDRPMSPEFEQLADPANFGLTDPEEVEGHRDSAAGKMLMAAVNCGVLLMPRSETASKIIDVSFNDRTLADFRAGVLAAGDQLDVPPQVREQLRSMLYGSGERSEWDMLAF